MKKLMVSLFLVMSLAATSVAFTACGDGKTTTEKAAEQTTATDGGASE